jgi:hypothetical protein
VSFTIVNENRVLENGEDLEIRFNSNSKAVSTDFFLLMVKLKEKTFYAETITFQPS